LGVLVAPETPFGKEMWRFDHPRSMSHPNDSALKGMRPDGYEPYPTQMYRITQKNPWRWESERAADEVMQRNLESRGFVYGGLAKAVDAYEKEQQEMALLAAARNYEDRNMSEKAKAESNAVEQASAKHLGEIPEKKNRDRA
jgi:hypothetical protein